MELMMESTIIYMDTFTPSQRELQECPHIILTSSHPWNPNTVKLPKAEYELHDIIHDYRLISATQRSDVAQSDEVIDDVSSIFNLTAMHRRICVMKFLQKNPVQQLTRNEDIDTGRRPYTSHISKLGPSF